MIKVPFFRPLTRKIAPEYLEAACEGGRAELIEQVENEVCSMLNVPYVVAVANPTMAINLALCAIDIKRGDKMIASVNAHPAASLMIRVFDSEPLFCDIDIDTYNMCPSAIAEKLAQNKERKMRGVFYSVTAGQYAEIDAILKMARENKVLSIVESCGSFKPLPEGGAPDIFITSQFPIDSNCPTNLGFIATHNKKYVERARIVRDHGFVFKGADERICDYDVVEMGYDYRPSALDAAYTISALPRFIDSWTKRIDIAAAYDRAFSNLAHVKTPVKRGEHIYSSYIVKIDKNRDNFAKILFEKGVETRLNYVPLHLMSYYRSKYSIKITEYPRALSNYQHILSLPIYSDLSDREIDAVINAVKEANQSRMW